MSRETHDDSPELKRVTNRGRSMLNAPAHWHAPAKMSFNISK